ncbi:MAG: sigma-70 family RNA polymerase sigma factor [bacterium]|nr:sigma-70 family RNA polymerase sigma factor [bacterium]
MNYDDIFIETNIPALLNEEEVKKYFLNYKLGDKNARKILIEGNIRLVIAEVLKKFNTTSYDRKDLISTGLIGLIKSIDTFDLSKKVKFTTYAIRCIDNEILMFIRKNKKYKNDESIDREFNFDEDNNVVILQNIIQSENSDFVLEYENKEVYRTIRETIDELSERDRYIVVLYFGFLENRTYTQLEISKKLNISQPYVSRIISEILKKLGKELQEKGAIECDEIIKHYDNYSNHMIEKTKVKLKIK